MKKEKENLRDILPSHSFQRTGRQRDRQKFIDFCCRHHKLFISLTSRYYPLKPDTIEKFSEKWSWYRLSRYRVLSWTVELIEKFNDKWAWNQLMNEVIWKKIFAQNVDDELVEKVMERSSKWSSQEGVERKKYSN